ncbi:phosphotransferase family protein [Gordonia sp. TBRC 11910]|uniref:Phosphotransferase family protein n=1 Tax=Gordonia asplenii TaxID=2725283 RepID=A0A848KX69_9ACTN|nr:phosphotransferase family protein [Gordonia asplenii]NMO02919.1 phosphotransferase family protein [Gordonia asplenii]
MTLSQSGRPTHDAAAPADPPGLDLRALGDYLATHLTDPPGSSPAAEQLVGGRSNLTYVISDSARRWVLRRPPLGHVLATAHDVAREYRVLHALADSPLPVPRTFLLCTDEQILGAPFYLMEWVDGIAYRSAGQLDAIGTERTQAVALRMIDHLADLHSLHPGELGLADLGRPEGFLLRQVRRWHSQLQASRSRDLDGVDELYDRLRARTPDRTSASLIHGDYKLDNLLFTDDDEVAAVLDWEMSTLGDPLTDLALLVSRSPDQSVGHGRHNPFDATSARGYPTSTDIVERYARRCDRDLDELDWYVALAHYKRAAILEGIYYRHLRQQTVGAGFDTAGDLVAPAIAAGLAALPRR